MIKLGNNLYVKQTEFPSPENDKLYKVFGVTVNNEKRELKRN